MSNPSDRCGRAGCGLTREWHRTSNFGGHAFAEPAPQAEGVTTQVIAGYTFPAFPAPDPDAAVWAICKRHEDNVISLADAVREAIAAGVREEQRACIEIVDEVATAIGVTKTMRDIILGVIASRAKGAK